MPEQFAIGAVPAWSIETAIVAVGLAAGCALVSELFCITLHTTEHLYKISSIAGLADSIRRGDCDCFDASDRFDPLQRKRRLPD
ncbi:MAG: hypothetical protein ACLT76_00360 [Clostridium fessum]